MRKFLIGLFVGLSMTVVIAQPFPPPLQQAITQLTTGVIPFSTLGMNAGGYVNFGVARQASGYGLRDNNGTIQSKNSGGSWNNLFSGTVPNPLAKFILQQADGTMTNAQALGALSSGLLVNTTTTGVLSAYAGVTCSNSFLRALSAVGASTCNSVVLTSDVTGLLPPTNGGTGLGSFTTGDLIYANSGTTLTQLSDVAVGSYVRSGGTSTAPLWSTQVLPNGSTTGDVFIATSTNTMGSLADVAVGSYLRAGGAATAPLWSTVTLPNTATAGDLWYASGANTMTALPDVSAGSYLRSGGVTTAPIWSTLVLPNAASQGDIIVGTSANTLGSVVDVSVGSYLRSGGVSTVPLWSTVVIPNTATTGDLWQATGSNTVTALAAVAAGSYLRSGGVTTASLWSTLLLPNAATTGDILYASSTNTIGNLADVAAGAYLRSGGTTTAPLWSTLILPNAVSQNAILYGSAANTVGSFGCSTTGSLLVGGSPPSCTANAMSPPILLSNSTAYTPIVSTSSETYFGIGSDGLIPAGAINAAKHRISVVLRGVYGTNNGSDTIVLRVKLCTVSGCGSGTVATMAVTGTVTPGSGVTNQGWETVVDMNVYTSGATGTLDAQGFTRFALTSTTATPNITMLNTSTVTVDTTVNEYVSASIQFNNNLAANTFTLRNFATYVY